jgi:siderophore synthetase component
MYSPLCRGNLADVSASSTRTVIIAESPLALKLAVGMKVSSALRTISHFTTNIGPRLSEEILPKLAIDPKILYVEREIATAACLRDEKGAPVDQDIAKHFTAVLRQPYVAQDDEAVILAAALGETGYADLSLGVPAVQHLLGLNTYQKRLSFFDEYVALNCYLQVELTHAKA